MKLYYSVPNEKCDEIEECGIDISENAEGEIDVRGKLTKCIFAYLVPGDVRYNTSTHSLVTLEVDPLKISVAEGALRGTSFSVKSEENFTESKLYYDSFIPLDEYTFGSFLYPECPVTASFLPGTIKRYDGRRDFPVLHENSKLVYAERVFSEFCAKYGDMRLYAVSCFCESLCANGIMKKLIVGENTVFIDNESGRKIIFS